MRIRILALFGAMMAIAGPAVYAGSIKATFKGQDNAIGISTNLGGETAGAFNWTLDQVVTSPLLGAYGNTGKFQTFCIQLNQYISQNQQVLFTETTAIATAPLGGFGPMGTVRAGLISQLFAEIGDITPANVNLAQHDIESAGFQVAIWEIVMDGNGALNLSSGAFSLTSSAVKTAAQAFISGMSAAYTAQVVALTNQDFQDQAILAAANITVPLPGAVAAILPIMMLGGKALSKRRRQQDEQIACA